MDLRKHLGAVIDDVRIKSETYILERSGKAVAMISPVHASSDDRSIRDRRLRALNDMAGLGRHQSRAKDIDAWLDRERSNWRRNTKLF